MCFSHQGLSVLNGESCVPLFHARDDILRLQDGVLTHQWPAESRDRSISQRSQSDFLLVIKLFCAPGPHFGGQGGQGSRQEPFHQGNRAVEASQGGIPACSHRHPWQRPVIYTTQIGVAGGTGTSSLNLLTLSGPVESHLPSLQTS